MAFVQNVITERELKMLMVREKKFYKSFFGLTFAIALQNVIVYVVNLADNVMLGKFAENALSGAALVNQIQFLLQMMVIGVGEGAMIFASRSWGEGNVSDIKRVTNISVKCALFVSLLLFAFCFCFPQTILGFLCNDADIVQQGVKYLKIVCFSYPIFAIAQSLLSMLRSAETVKIGFIIAFISLVVNVCLNYILIFGKMGFSSMGIEGAAIATLISRIVELIISVIYVFYIDKKIKLKLLDLLCRAKKELLKVYFKKGMPVFLSSTMWGVAQAVQTAIIGHTTAAAVAANSIAATMFSILSVVLYASATSTAVIIGKTIGEGHTEKIKPYAKTLQILFVLIGLVTGAVLYLVKDPVIAFYDVSPQAKVTALRFMTILAVTVVGTAYQMPCNSGIIRAGGDTTFLLKIDTAFMWLIVIPAAFVSAFILKLPVEITYICLKCDQILKCFVSVVKVNRFKFIKTLKD